jgi:hypothetical protein
MGSTTSRDDFFVLIHKALRRGLFDAAIEAGRLDWTDRVQVASFTSSWSRLVTLVQGHAASEDDHIWPLLESKRPGGVAELGIGHDAVEADIEAVDAELRLVLQDPSPAAGLTFYRALSRFLAHALQHFANEEPAAMEVLWASCTDEELAACRAGFMAMISPEERAWTFELVLQSSTTAEQLATLGALRSAMPDNVFRLWIDQVGRTLSPAASRRLAELLPDLERVPPGAAGRPGRAAEPASFAPAEPVLR